ncbi:hypothetical protein HaLaN_15764 [Haematococcus lacustris]|uniref:Uncharacterized protein n=1 Tax=Haematococcus lacustris TaxID=44745 RepID=A0A699Z8B3_HAELA|nr:hypothetical protein HaLaN_15764 [Haematococcus lacustris]
MPAEVASEKQSQSSKTGGPWLPHTFRVLCHDPTTLHIAQGAFAESSTPDTVANSSCCGAGKMGLLLSLRLARVKTSNDRSAGMAGTRADVRWCAGPRAQASGGAG